MNDPKSLALRAYMESMSGNTAEQAAGLMALWDAAERQGFDRGFHAATSHRAVIDDLMSDLLVPTALPRTSASS